jgi:hypothetical protein
MLSCGRFGCGCTILEWYPSYSHHRSLICFTLSSLGFNFGTPLIILDIRFEQLAGSSCAGSGGGAQPLKPVLLLAHARQNPHELRRNLEVATEQREVAGVVLLAQPGHRLCHRLADSKPVVWVPGVRFEILLEIGGAPWFDVPELHFSILFHISYTWVEHYIVLASGGHHLPLVHCWPPDATEFHPTQVPFFP